MTESPLSNPSPLANTHRIVWTALMAALIAAGAYIQIPLGPVPISMQTYFVLLTGFLLGSIYGSLAVALYLTAGLIGLPVYAGGTSGVAKLFGPTGGFLFGFLLVAAVAGIATRDHESKLGWGSGALWGGLALATTYTLGVPWLKYVLDLGWQEAFYAGMLPFLPGAVLKLLLAIGTCRFLADRRLLPP